MPCTIRVGSHPSCAHPTRRKYQPPKRHPSMLCHAYVLLAFKTTRMLHPCRHGPGELLVKEYESRAEGAGPDGRHAMPGTPPPSTPCAAAEPGRTSGTLRLCPPAARMRIERLQVDRF